MERECKGNRLLVNQYLIPEDYLLSADGAFKLILQPDSNLVLYRLIDDEALWSTNTSGAQVQQAIMQKDGNFVLYDYEKKSVWSSNTADPKNINSTLIVQNDGNVVIYQPQVPIWNTSTVK